MSRCWSSFSRRPRRGPGERVLDIGCGTGVTTVPYAQAVGPSGHVTGADISRPMLEAARRRVDEAGLTNVELILADAQVHRLRAGYLRSADLAARGHVFRRSRCRLPQPDPARCSPGAGWSWRCGRRSTKTRTGRSRSRSRCAISGRRRRSRRTRREGMLSASAIICAAFSIAAGFCRDRDRGAAVSRPRRYDSGSGRARDPIQPVAAAARRKTSRRGGTARRSCAMSWRRSRLCDERRRAPSGDIPARRAQRPE